MRAKFTKLIIACSWLLISFNSLLAQNVGIGIDTPMHKLDVGGNIRGTNIYTTGWIGIGTTAPNYKLHIYDGSLAITNTADAATWVYRYEPLFAGMTFIYNGSSKMTLQNSGDLGVGTTNPQYKLDVIGNAHIQTDAAIGGNLTVNNGRGVLQNAHGSGQLKYYTRTVTFNITLPGFGMTPEQSIGFNGTIFSSPPKVFVGDIVSTGGTVGDLFRIQMVLYGVTTTGCHAVLINTSPNPVSYSTTWNIVCLGE